MIWSKCWDIFDICSAETASSAELELISRLPSSRLSMVPTTSLVATACCSMEDAISWVSWLRWLVARAMRLEPEACCLVASPISRACW